MSRPSRGKSTWVSIFSLNPFFLNTNLLSWMMRIGGALQIASSLNALTWSLHLLQYHVSVSSSCSLSLYLRMQSKSCNAPSPGAAAATGSSSGFILLASSFARSSSLHVNFRCTFSSWTRSAMTADSSGAAASFPSPPPFPGNFHTCPCELVVNLPPPLENTISALAAISPSSLYMALQKESTALLASATVAPPLSLKIMGAHIASLCA
mmetsp:Transcript_27423/g.54801  ORF Transcript_27423/g.54801 Transcript_27423/m.54801 type:complete len:209 (+) Transcript_27423:524-1150(+)